MKSHPNTNRGFGTMLEPFLMALVTDYPLPFLAEAIADA
jgi:hypothetical protein